MTDPQTIKHARLARGLTQRQAAEQLGVPRHTWARWERGERHPRGLYALALARWLAKPAEGQGGR